MPGNIQLSEVDIVETEKVELREPLVILGFIGPGMVGGIAVAHITDQLKMSKGAHIRSGYMPLSWSLLTVC